jgi:hypothetical protein
MSTMLARFGHGFHGGGGLLIVILALVALVLIFSMFADERKQSGGK